MNPLGWISDLRWNMLEWIGLQNYGIFFRQWLHQVTCSMHQLSFSVHQVSAIFIDYYTIDVHPFWVVRDGLICCSIRIWSMGRSMPLYSATLFDTSPEYTPRRTTWRPSCCNTAPQEPTRRTTPYEPCVGRVGWGTAPMKKSVTHWWSWALCWRTTLSWRLFMVFIRTCSLKEYTMRLFMGGLWSVFFVSPNLTPEQKRIGGDKDAQNTKHVPCGTRNRSKRSKCPQMVECILLEARFQLFWKGANVYTLILHHPPQPRIGTASF